MRSWLVIPALGAACAGVAAGLAALAGGASAIAPATVIACGAVGAGMSACVRALAGDSTASLVGAVLAPLLFVATLFDSSAFGVHEARAVIAVAAAAWAAVELARPSMSPLVALLPATVAGVLDASFLALVPIASVRVMTAPWERPRWAPAVPLLGGVLALVGLAACLAHAGTFARLGAAWWGPRAAESSLVMLFEKTAVELGPLTAVAGIVGVVSFLRPRHAELGLALCVAGAIASGVRSGSVPPGLVGMATLATGLAVARLAALVRLAQGQVIVGVMTAALVLLVPAWSAIEHGRRVPPAHVLR